MKFPMFIFPFLFIISTNFIIELYFLISFLLMVFLMVKLVLRYILWLFSSCYNVISLFTHHFIYSSV